MTEFTTSYSYQDLTFLIKESHDSALLKRILEKKLSQYIGISREELELICAMLDIRRGDEI